MKGIDCATRLTVSTAAAVRAAGYEFAGRYLVPNAGSLAWKALTRAEAEIVTGAGLRLLTVWETTADRVKGGAAAGAADGARARLCAESIGMPETGIIYFAVDYEATAADMRTIAEYLQAARANTGPYEIGVYGSYSVIEDMAARGVCRGFWQCLAWSYGRLSAHRTVYQHGFGQQIAGVPIDVNDCPDLDRAGIWTYPSAEEPAAPERYERMDALPDWARETVAKLVDRGIIKGRGTAYDADGRPADLGLTEDMLRLLVWNDREGVYDKDEMEERNSED